MNNYKSKDNLHTSVPQIKFQKTVLSNGIRVVTEEIPYVRSVSVGVWIDVGSRDESKETNGITHFIEHMVFKGTKNYSNQQIARSLESVGGYLNAFTTKEHTCFYARILDEHIDRALDVIADLIQNPTFTEKEIEKEKLVVLEELKNIEDDPDDIIHDILDKNIYEKHPLGYPVIGTDENIKKFTRNLMLKHISKYFVPQRMVIAAAGNLKHEIFTSLVEKKFSLKMRKADRSVRDIPISSGLVKTEMIEKPINQAYVCIGTKASSIKSEHRYPLLLLNTLFGEGMSSRLFQNIREKYGFAYSIYSFVNLMSDTGIFGVYVGTDNKNISRSIDLIYKEMSKLRTREIGKSELNRTKAQMKGSLMLGLENMSNRMMRLGSSELYFGRYIAIDEVIEGVNAIKAHDVYNVSNLFLKKERFSTVIFQSNKEK
ncbi:MAG: insulinase family protein [Ignavibacteriales bacterium]|nr:insulinase family protein [Ignavibacteriales bacterium]